MGCAASNPTKDVIVVSGEHRTNHDDVLTKKWRGSAAGPRPTHPLSAVVVDGTSNDTMRTLFDATPSESEQHDPEYHDHLFSEGPAAPAVILTKTGDLGGDLAASCCSSSSSSFRTAPSSCDAPSMVRINPTTMASRTTTSKATTTTTTTTMTIPLQESRSFSHYERSCQQHQQQQQQHDQLRSHVRSFPAEALPHHRRERPLFTHPYSHCYDHNFERRQQREHGLYNIRSRRTHYYGPTFHPPAPRVNSAY